MSKFEFASQEEMDAMRDVDFCDCCDEFMERVQANAVSEDEVEEADQRVKAAFARRFAD